jgi:phage terminase large subunit
MKQYNLVVTAHSSNLIKEFNNYTWIKDKNGGILDKPIDAFNHGIDAARY